MDPLMNDIEADERWLTAHAPRLSPEADTLQRAKLRVRAGLAALDGLPHSPRPFVVARIKHAVRHELTSAARDQTVHSVLDRRSGLHALLWGAGWASIAAAVLAVALGLRLGSNGDGGGSGRTDGSSLDVFVAALDQPADQLEQQLAALAEDVSAAEELGMTFAADTWEDDAIDELDNSLDDVQNDAESIWDVS